MPVRFNRRNKVALCGTLVCLGLILLYGHVSARHIAGVLLLGLAYSWAIGSNSRIVHWLFICFGFLLLLAAATDGYFWPQTKLQPIESQKLLIQSDHSVIDSDNEIIRLDIQMMATDPRHRPDPQVSAQLLQERGNLIKHEGELTEIQNEPAVVHVLKNDWATVLGGLLLLPTGLGLIFGIKKPAKVPDAAPANL